jgi:hypothetical protein
MVLMLMVQDGNELLKQLIGEWAVGIALKKDYDKAVAGCGDMTAKETSVGISSEIETQIAGYEDYYENDVWGYDPQKDEVHLFSSNSDGEFRDHVGRWVDGQTLELEWRGTFEDQDETEHIRAFWASKDQLELRETHRKMGEVVLTIDYVFKRKESAQQLMQDSH